LIFTENIFCNTKGKAMHQKFSFTKIGLTLVAIVSVAIWALLIWEHYHGGVPSHSFMARKDMPSISNWWGGLLLPLLTYFSIYRIQKRVFTEENKVVKPKELKSILLLFLAGLIYAGSMAYCFVTEHEDINGILFQGLFILALIFPLYRAEFFLGFVIGLTYTFGAILPTFIASVFVGLSYVAHKLLYPFILKIYRRSTVKN
jgi:hypothetical protein